MKGKPQQFHLIDEAIRTAQFVRNKTLKYWMDNRGIDKYDLNKYCAVLAKEFEFANKLNSQARQSSAERVWSGIARFYENCKKKIKGKKGYPRFRKNVRSVEYKTTGWKLSECRRHLALTDGFKIGRLKLVGTRDLNFYQLEQVKRVRLVRRADGYYAQFAVDVERSIEVNPTQQAVGLDVGLESFYTDSQGNQKPNPRFYRTGESKLKRAQKRVCKRKKGSKNRAKARRILGRKHLKISRQRIEHAKRLARCVILSNDVVAYEDLRVRHMVCNHNLAKSINDVGWYQFRMWLEYFGKVFGRVTIAVPPQYTSQECSSCGIVVKKSLSTRTHECRCGADLGRDHNAAINILRLGLSTAGHVGTWLLDSSNAWGETSATLVGENLPEQLVS